MKSEKITVKKVSAIVRSTQAHLNRVLNKDLIGKRISFYPFRDHYGKKLNPRNLEKITGLCKGVEDTVFFNTKSDNGVVIVCYLLIESPCGRRVMIFDAELSKIKINEE